MVATYTIGGEVTHNSNTHTAGNNSHTTEARSHMVATHAHTHTLFGTDHLSGCQQNTSGLRIGSPAHNGLDRFNGEPLRCFSRYHLDMLYIGPTD